MRTNILTMLVALIACTIGKMCGMGGGVIIKPVLDALRVSSGTAINFMSCCTVFGMSLFSVGKGIIRKDSVVNWKLSSFLAIGAAIGGYFGKTRYLSLETYFPDGQTASGIQSCVLLLFLILTFLYTRNKNKIPSFRVTNSAASCFIGMFLGTVSSFLGIGGGPFNMAVLFLFFSMETKVAVENSLYIIFISQLFALVKSIINGIPEDVDLAVTLGMILFGILGAEAGSRINARIDNEKSTSFLKGSIVLIMVICIYNIYTKLLMI